MMVRLSRSVPAVLLAAVAACTTPANEAPAASKPAPPAPITQEQVEQAIQGAVTALNAGDVAKAGATYAADAIFVNARGKYETETGITAFWAAALKTPSAGKNLKLEIVKWGTSGDMAYSVSRFTGGITAPTGYSFAVALRQPDGSLKTVAQVSIPDPPAGK